MRHNFNLLENAYITFLREQNTGQHQDIANLNTKKAKATNMVESQDGNEKPDFEIYFFFFSS